MAAAAEKERLQRDAKDMSEDGACVALASKRGSSKVIYLSGAQEQRHGVMLRKPLEGQPQCQKCTHELGREHIVERDGALNSAEARATEVRSFNAGGLTAESYDYLCYWLQHKCQDDIIILQELHWGCGRSDSSWAIPGWTFYITADSQQRFSGTGVILSSRLAMSAAVTYCTWVPGRLLQVRCCSPKVTLDIVAGYQWTNLSDASTKERRSHFWGQLSRLLHSIPQRNMVVLGADLNTRCAPIPGLVGRGVLRSAQGRDPELEDRSQIDFRRCVVPRQSLKQQDARAQALRSAVLDIFSYFEHAFDCDTDFALPQREVVHFTENELIQAITQLKGGKAVPRALRRAGATEPLVQAILVLHEQCVRQGCTLSPFLFALFTCLVYDTLAERTNAAWASYALTLFADDTWLREHKYVGPNGPRRISTSNPLCAESCAWLSKLHDEIMTLRSACDHAEFTTVMRTHQAKQHGRVAQKRTSTASGGTTAWTEQVPDLRAIRNPQFNQVLREHCVVCGQWGNRLKQHIRRMHPEIWALKTQAETQSRSLGLLVANPCHYCAQPAKQECGSMSAMQTENEEALQTRRDLEAVLGKKSPAQLATDKEPEQAAHPGVEGRDGGADQDY
ncbi:unnamed protein product [Symbiodinium sp. CCMP2592]|nr:unnamed protein product [Symbiodinium sp. CCMP2592]